MNEGKTKIAFGVGICMQNNWELIQKYFQPDFLSDNDSVKWNTYPLDGEIMCISPQQILDMSNPYVLIAIGDPYAVQSVRMQLEDMGIDCVAIIDLLPEWGMLEPLPQHLCKIVSMNSARRIFLLNTPEHDNVGDHLITLAEIQFFESYFRNYEWFEITDMEYVLYGRRLAEYINAEDILLITGGGFLGSLWLYNGEWNVRNVIESYPENRIVILPQTIFFENSPRGIAEEIKTKKIYRNHKKLLVCLREKKSFKKMCELLGDEQRCLLIPDMALYLDYSEKQYEREGVLLCLRKDKESILSEQRKNDIISYLQLQGIGYDYTLMHTGNCFCVETRMEEVKRKARQMKSYKLVITDTLHGMILCAITGTPCLAFDNLSQKVSGVYDWIKHLPYVRFCNKADFVIEYMEALLQNKGERYNKTVLENYYKDLSVRVREH